MVGRQDVATIHGCASKGLSCIFVAFFVENNVLNCSLFSNKSIWNCLSSWERTRDKMNMDYTCFISELKTHPECKSFTNSSQNQKGSAVWKHLESQNSSPSHIRTNTLISSNSSSTPYQERSSLLQPWHALVQWEPTGPCKDMPGRKKCCSMSFLPGCREGGV